MLATVCVSALCICSKHDLISMVHKTVKSEENRMNQHEMKASQW